MRYVKRALASIDSERYQTFDAPRRVSGFVDSLEDEWNVTGAIVSELADYYTAAKQAAAKAKPPPMAWPFTAAITGTGRL